jgi:phytanoyl-CoA hydroxylase
MLSPEDIAAYRSVGYVLVEGAVPPDSLARINEIVDDFVAKARGVTANNEVYDLESTHTPEAPRVRRLKEPVERHPLFWELVRSPGVIGPVTQLLGPDVRLHGSKLNMKSAGYGAAVEWHQDWAFYPHTNDDLLAVGIMLDDVALENGPLMVVPGSHRGKIFDHHHDGYFAGAVNLATERPDLAAAATLTAKAGSMTIHHVRALHGSALNLSNRPRRMLFYEIAAADAWPLFSDLPNYRDFAHFNDRMIVGQPTVEPRVVPAPIRLPLPIKRKPESIYALQSETRNRYFGDYEEAVRKQAT